MILVTIYIAIVYKYVHSSRKKRWKVQQYDETGEQCFDNKSVKEDEKKSTNWCGAGISVELERRSNITFRTEARASSITRELAFHRCSNSTLTWQLSGR